MLSDCSACVHSLLKHALLGTFVTVDSSEVSSRFVDSLSLGLHSRPGDVVGLHPWGDYVNHHSMMLFVSLTH